MGEPWSWPASTLMRVVDGDTVVAQLTRDIGFHGVVTFEQKLRLARINCPPASTDLGKAATVYVQNRVGLTFNITTTKPYKYGDEWMAELVLLDGTNLSDALVAAGLAVLWDGSGPRPGGLVSSRP